MANKVSLSNNSGSKVSRLTQEAICLFGQQIVNQCRQVSIEELATEAKQVAEGARQLRELSGQPEQQRAIIKGMDELTALALCRWLIEPRCMAPFMARHTH